MSDLSGLSGLSDLSDLSVLSDLSCRVEDTDSEADTPRSGRPRSEMPRSERPRSERPRSERPPRSGRPFLTSDSRGSRVGGCVDVELTDVVLVTLCTDLGRLETELDAETFK